MDRRTNERTDGHKDHYIPPQLCLWGYNKTVFYQIWYDKNIVYISDLFDESGMFYSLNDLQKHYKIKTIFLMYIQLKHTFQQSQSRRKIISPNL